MPVHNAMPYLDEAVESILNQTFADFEFVILDDASTDGSSEKLREWASKDPRIRLFRVEENLGPVLSSDRVARGAGAQLVARMDADDISHPDRLRQQMQVIRDNPEVGLVACLSDLIDGSGRTVRGPDLWRLVRRSQMVPFPHGAVLYRRELFDRIGGYRSEAELWEDQDLVTRMGAAAKIMVIPKALYSVRQTAVSTRSIAGRERQERAIDAMYRSIAEPAARSADGKIDPRVFLSLGSVILWSGGRPRLFARLLRHGRLSASRPTISALGWTAWASASPASLRAALRVFACGRNFVARRKLGTDTPIIWCPDASAAPTPTLPVSVSATQRVRSRKRSS